MSEVVDFASRKAELEGVSGSTVVETPKPENVRLVCNTCSCMSFEIDGNNNVLCAGCGVLITVEGVDLVLRLKNFDPGAVLLEKEPQPFVQLSNWPLESLLNDVRKDEEGLVFILAAFASGAIRYKLASPVENGDNNRIEWIYSRTSAMLEAEGVDLEDGN